MTTDTPPIDAEVPEWAIAARPMEAFWRGLASFLSTPGYVLMGSALGFGALVRDMGLSIDFAIATSFIFYALPAQVVLADQVGRGASLISAAVAVSLTGVRMLPMTITLAPMLRDPKGRRWLEVFAVHFIAVTAWLEGHRRLHRLPAEIRLPHMLGFGLAFMLCTVSGACVGYILAASVPVGISAALMSFTPCYFLMAMLASSRLAAEYLAIVLGVVIGPFVYLVSPDLDLVVAGLAGGTIAYVVSR
ncbi:MAG: AzlC family ABC transporter permease [Hyphomicrobiaceae bacterium]